MKKRFAFNLSTCAQRGFDGKDVGGAEECFNFKLDGGALVDGFTLSYATFGEEKVKVNLPENFVTEHAYCAMTTHGERMLVFGKDGEGNLCSYCLDCDDVSQGFIPFGLSIERPVFSSLIINDNHVIAITDRGGTLYVYDGRNTTSGNCPTGVNDLAWHFERMVAVTDDKVYFSVKNSPFNYTYSSESVFALDHGIVGKRVTVFANELIIAGDRGMCRIINNEYDGVFYMRNVYSFGERIFVETIASCSVGVYFVSERGLGVYDGAGVNFKHATACENIISAMSGFVLEGRYHAVVEVPDIARKTRVIIFDDEGWQISDTDVKCAFLRADQITPTFITGKGKVLYSIGGAPAQPSTLRRYRTRPTNFGINGKKTLTEFSLRTARPLKLIIEADGKRRVYRINSRQSSSVIRPYILGDTFCFEISCEGSGTSVFCVEAVIEVI